MRAFGKNRWFAADKTAVKFFFEGAIHRARSYKIRNVRITITNVDIQRDCQFGKTQTVSDLAPVVRLRGSGENIYFFILFDTADSFESK